MKYHLYKVFLCLCVCLAIIITKPAAANAQLLPDTSNNEFLFGRISYFEIRQLKDFYLCNNLFSIDSCLRNKGFFHNTTDTKLYQSDSDDYSCQFDIKNNFKGLDLNSFGANNPVLVLSSTANHFKGQLCEFIRREKWEDDLYSEQYSKGGYQATLFSNIYRDKKLCVIVSPTRAYLIIY